MSTSRHRIAAVVSVAAVLSNEALSFTACRPCRSPASHSSTGRSMASRGLVSKPQQAIPEALSWAGVVLEQLPMRVAELGPFGPAYFFLIYAAALCFAVPATPFTLSAGFLFGLPLGFSVSLVSGGVAASICFLLSRTFLQPLVSRFTKNSKVFSSINRAVEREGFKIIFLLRLSPLMPFSALSYVCGLSKVKFREYFFANLLGFSPPTMMFIYFATIARRVADHGSGLPWPVYAASIVVTLLLVRWAALIAQGALREADQAEAAAVVNNDLSKR